MPVNTTSHITSPKAIALWLIHKTSLTFEQIATFCGMHVMDVSSIADEIASRNLAPKDPIALGYLTKEEISRGESNESVVLKSSKHETSVKHKKRSYTSIAERHNRPRAILWLVQQFPGIDVKDLKTLTGATKSIVEKIKSSTYQNLDSVQPRDPISLGLCTQTDFDKISAKYSE